MKRFRFRIEDGKACLDVSKVSAGLELAQFLVFFGFWYYLIFGLWLPSMLGIEAEDTGMFILNLVIFIIFAGFPLLWIPKLFRALRAVFGGAGFIIDKRLGVVSRNGKELCAVSSVEGAQLRVFTNSDGPSEYRLSLVLFDGKKVFIDQGTQKDEFYDLADRIADFLDVKAIVKA